ncbi:MAG: DUF6491 family protein [Rhizomicrobium sp.]|jgi:hypothetical protein
MRIGYSAIVLLAGFVSAPAIAQQSACLVIKQIYNWDVIDRQTLIVEDIFHHKFKVGLNGPCPRIDFDMGAGFKSFGNTDLDCLRRGDQVVHNGAGMGNTCFIRSVEPYVPGKPQAAQAAPQQQDGQ